MKIVFEDAGFRNLLPLVYWRADPISDHTIDFDTGNMKSKMTYRLSAGPADWVGWVGGDGS